MADPCCLHDAPMHDSVRACCVRASSVVASLECSGGVCRILKPITGRRPEPMENASIAMETNKSESGEKYGDSIHVHRVSECVSMFLIQNDYKSY